MYQLCEVELSVEEVEALRLKDIEAFDQSICAQKMEISRSTFQRVLISARTKVADALLNGKALKIYGGNFALEPMLSCRQSEDCSEVCCKQD